MRKKLTGQQCQCTKCEKVFKSEFGFNKHRAGQHGINRRCLSTEEMLSKGMAQNARGLWVSELNTDLRGVPQGEIAQNSNTPA